MALYTRIKRVDKLGRERKVKLDWNEFTLAAFFSLAERQGVLEDLRSQGRAALKEDDFILNTVILGEKVEQTDQGKAISWDTRSKKVPLRAGTLLEMWRIG